MAKLWVGVKGGGGLNSLYMYQKITYKVKNKHKNKNQITYKLQLQGLAAVLSPLHRWSSICTLLLLFLRCFFSEYCIIRMEFIRFPCITVNLTSVYFPNLGFAILGEFYSWIIVKLKLFGQYVGEIDLILLL